MGGTNGAAELELVAEMRVEGADDLTRAGHVDKGGRDGGIQGADGVVGDDLIAGPQARDEADIARRSQADDAGATFAVTGKQVRQAQAGLGRGAADQHLPGTEESIVHQVVVENVGGREEREEQAALVLHGGQGGRIAGGALIGVVDRRQVCAMRGTIGKASVRRPGGPHHDVAGHGQEAPDPLAHGDLRSARGDDVGKPPDGHDPPGFRGGEEPPVADHVAGEGVADVVRGYRELVDGHEDLALRQLRRLQGNCSRFGEGRATHLNLGDHFVSSCWARRSRNDSMKKTVPSTTKAALP